MTTCIKYIAGTFSTDDAYKAWLAEQLSITADEANLIYNAFKGQNTGVLNYTARIVKTDMGDSGAYLVLAGWEGYGTVRGFIGIKDGKSVGITYTAYNSVSTFDNPIYLAPAYDAQYGHIENVYCCPQSGLKTGKVYSTSEGNLLAINVASSFWLLAKWDGD